MNRRAYRRQWNRLKDKYELRGQRIFRKAIRDMALTIPFDQLTPGTYKAYIVSYITEEPIREAFYKTHLQTALAHGKRIGQGINKEIAQKNFSLPSFENVLVQFIQNFLLSIGGQRIVSMRQNLAEYIIEYIAKSLEDNKDIRTIARELEKHFRSRGFYRWQIERIVRTETTAAANYGASIATNNSGIVYEKEWISSNDSRTRQREKGDQFDHLDMDGIKVDPDKPFNVNGDFIMYPGDPDGHPANIINCRCTVATVPKRDENGRLIFRDAQSAAGVL